MCDLDSFEPLFYGLGPILYGLGSFFYGLGSLFYGLGSLFYRLGPILYGLGSLFYGLGSLFYGLGSFFLLARITFLRARITFLRARTHFLRTRTPFVWASPQALTSTDERKSGKESINSAAIASNGISVSAAPSYTVVLHGIMALYSTLALRLGLQQQQPRVFRLTWRARQSPASGLASSPRTHRPQRVNNHHVFFCLRYNCDTGAASPSTPLSSPSISSGGKSCIPPGGSAWAEHSDEDVRVECPSVHPLHRKRERERPLFQTIFPAALSLFFRIPGGIQGLLEGDAFSGYLPEELDTHSDEAVTNSKQTTNF